MIKVAFLYASNEQLELEINKKYSNTHTHTHKERVREEKRKSEREICTGPECKQINAKKLKNNDERSQTRSK